MEKAARKARTHRLRTTVTDTVTVTTTVTITIAMATTTTTTATVEIRKASGRMDHIDKRKLEHSKREHLKRTWKTNLVAGADSRNHKPKAHILRMITTKTRATTA